MPRSPPPHRPPNPASQQGYVIPLQNTTQQPSLTRSPTAPRVSRSSKTPGTAPSAATPTTPRATIARLAQLRARKSQAARLSQLRRLEARKPDGQDPRSRAQIHGRPRPAATANAESEAKDIQAVIDAQKGGFQLQPWDWNFYAEQVRKAKYDLDESQVRPYFELNNVLQNGVFYAANQLYGSPSKNATNARLPARRPRLRSLRRQRQAARPLLLRLLQARQQERRRLDERIRPPIASCSAHCPSSTTSPTSPSPPRASPRSSPSPTSITMFHEFGHALHGMFSNTEYPSLSGTSVARDFVEFPSQFNEHWATYPAIFNHYAKHYKTGEPMPAELAAKIEKSAPSTRDTPSPNSSPLPSSTCSGTPSRPSAPLEDATPSKSGTREEAPRSHDVPPRYRSSYFSHIWGGGYAAGYYAYLWAEMLDDDAFQWFVDHGGLTRANGDRFRQMVLSRGNTEDLANMFAAWRGAPPSTKAMMKDRGLTP